MLLSSTWRLEGSPSVSLPAPWKQSCGPFKSTTTDLHCSSVAAAAHKEVIIVSLTRSWRLAARRNLGKKVNGFPGWIVIGQVPLSSYLKRSKGAPWVISPWGTFAFFFYLLISLSVLSSDPFTSTGVQLRALKEQTQCHFLVYWHNFRLQFYTLCLSQETLGQVDVKGYAVIN